VGVSVLGGPNDGMEVEYQGPKIAMLEESPKVIGERAEFFPDHVVKVGTYFARRIGHRQFYVREGLRLW
jgi:hypothetical protein